MPNNRAVVKEFIPVTDFERFEIDPCALQHTELFEILANWQNRPSVVALGHKVAGKPFCGDKSVRTSLLIHTNGAEKSFGRRTAFYSLWPHSNVAHLSQDRHTRAGL